MPIVAKDGLLLLQTPPVEGSDKVSTPLISALLRHAFVVPDIADGIAFTVNASVAVQPSLE
jgi:hypothetical protein